MNVILCEENTSTAGTVIIHHHFGICWYLSSSWWGLTSHDDQWGNKTVNKLKKNYPCVKAELLKTDWHYKMKAHLIRWSVGQ